MRRFIFVKNKMEGNGMRTKRYIHNGKGLIPTDRRFRTLPYRDPIISNDVYGGEVKHIADKVRKVL
jgi:hypothetical protein